MRILFSLLISAVIVLSVPAHARMYQWVDSDSGNTRLSGEPPEWYRSGEFGPRVLVFENGRLVDDTAVVLPPEQRKALREAAFLEIDYRREQDAVKKLERAALREARRREEASRQLSAQIKSQQQTSENKTKEEDNAQAATAESAPGALDGGMVEQLKALISAWDRENGTAEKP